MHLRKASNIPTIEHFNEFQTCFSERQVTYNQVVKVIKHLGNYSSTGYNNLSAQYLKLAVKKL